MSKKLILTFFLIPFVSWGQEDTTNSEAIKSINDSLIIIPSFNPEMHGTYLDLIPGNAVDSITFDINTIKGGWRRVVSSGYFTPNGDAQWEPNEVRGSIYFSDNKVYYMTYPLRMHAYADYKIDDQNKIQLFNQTVLPDSLGWFSENPTLFTKDSLSILYFDGEYYRKQEMDPNLVVELEEKIIHPKALIGNWEKTDTLTCCYGTIWWQEYPWDMPENLHISKAWAEKIYVGQLIYLKIDGELKPFFIAELSEYQLELEAGSWFVGDADRVVYQRRSD